MKSKKVGLLAVTAAAGMFATAPVIAGPKVVDGYYCSNNTCKGKSACGGYGNKNGCHGSNECKGKGWLQHDNKKDCEANGGKWAEAKAKKKKKSEEKDMKEKKSGSGSEG